MGDTTTAVVLTCDEYQILADRLAGYNPPHVPLRLTPDGRGSRTALVAYIRAVLEQRTTVNDDTTADRLAEGMATSVLSQLGAGHSIATGTACLQLVPAADPPRAAPRPVTPTLTVNGGTVTAPSRPLSATIAAAARLRSDRLPDADHAAYWPDPTPRP